MQLQQRQQTGVLLHQPPLSSVLADDPATAANRAAWERLARWERPGYGRSLGEVLVSEGLSAHHWLAILVGSMAVYGVVEVEKSILRRRK